MVQANQNTYIPKEIAKVELDKNKREYIKNKIFPTLSKSQINDLIIKILQQTLEKVVLDGTDWIKKYVPKATGQLQDMLIEALSKYSGSPSSNYNLALWLGTVNVPYIQYVANMPEKMVRHPKGSIYYKEYTRKYQLKDGTIKTYQARVKIDPNRRWVNYYRHRGYINLYDPKAVGRFWGLLKQHLRQRLRNRLHETILMNASAYAIRIKPFTDQFKVVRVDNP